VAFFNEDIEKLQDYVVRHVKATKDEAKVPADGQLYLGELAQLKEEDFNAILGDLFRRPE